MSSANTRGLVSFKVTQSKSSVKRMKGDIVSLKTTVFNDTLGVKMCCSVRGLFVMLSASAKGKCLLRFCKAS